MKKLLIAPTLCLRSCASTLARELEDVFLALYPDPDPKISAGAVWLTINLPKHDPLPDNLKQRAAAAQGPGSQRSSTVSALPTGTGARLNRPGLSADLPGNRAKMAALLEVEDSRPGASCSLVVEYPLTPADSAPAAACRARERFDKNCRRCSRFDRDFRRCF